MCKVPRERTKERTRPFVNSLRFKPPLKTLFELRECVFRERRIESREKLFCVDEVKRIERRDVFSHKNSQREKRVLGVSIRLFRPLVLKKASFKAAGRKRAKTRTLDEKERMKKEDEKAQTEESFIFPSKREERKTTCILTKESVLKRVLSQTRSFEEEERGQREASSFS